MEIWDYIVDYLWDDRDALMACSGTCRTLLSASRYRIFFTVSLGTCDRYESFKNLLQQPNYMASHVRSLRLLGREKPEGRDEEDKSEIPAFLESGDWLHLLPKLTRLIRLSLHHFTLRIPNELQGDLRSVVSKLRRLDYYAMKDDEGSLRTLLLHAAGSLSSLIISSTPTLQDEHSSVDPAGHQAAIRGLKTLVWNPSTPATDKGTTLFLDPDTPWRLQRLAMASIGSPSSPISFAQKLLNASMETLEHLSLDYADRIPTRRGAFLDLRQLRSLKSIHVTFNIQHTRAIIATLACLWCKELFPVLSAVSLRVALSLKDFTSTEEFGTDVAHQWARLRIPLLLLLSLHPLPRYTICIDIRELWCAPGVDVNAATPEELKQCQVLETQLVQNLLHSWVLPRAGDEGGLHYSFAWLTRFPVDPQAGITFPSYDRGDFLREPEWYHDLVAPLKLDCL